MTKCLLVISRIGALVKPKINSRVPSILFSNSFSSSSRIMSTVVVRQHDIIKSPEDDREYRGLVLPNGLKAVLVCDPSTDKAAAALDVHVGSMSDPKELPGLVSCIFNSS